MSEIKWELRPGGMLVQMRESGQSDGNKGLITIRVSTVSKSHDISIQQTSTFGKLLSLYSPLNFYYYVLEKKKKKRFFLTNSVICFAISGELKMILSLVTGMEPKEQRVLFKGKEREDGEYLHMVGVRDRDKVLLLQDPAIKEMKLHGLATACLTISV